MKVCLQRLAQPCRHSILPPNKSRRKPHKQPPLPSLPCRSLPGWMQPPDGCYMGGLPPEEPYDEEPASEPASSAPVQPPSSEEVFLAYQPGLQLFDMLGSALDLDIVRDRALRGEPLPHLHRDSEGSAPLNRWELFSLLKFPDEPIFRPGGQSLATCLLLPSHVASPSCLGRASCSSLRGQSPPALSVGRH